MKSEKQRYYDQFGKAWSASGARGFFGEGYWFHFLLKALGVDISKTTLVGKTTTWEPRPSLEMVMRCKFDLEYRKKFESLMGDWRGFAPKDCGNMPFQLEAPFAPTELFPKSIWANPISEVLGNSISLSGPGFIPLIESGLWQQLDDNFLLSLMSVKSDEEEVLDQLRQASEQIKRRFRHLSTKVGGQLNISCPNVRVNPLELLKKTEKGLDVKFPFPWIIKGNIFMPVGLLRDICQHPNCGGVCITNTFTEEQIKQYPDLHEKFLKAIGKKAKPLRWFPSAGYSGPFIYPRVLEYLREFREDGNNYYVNAGGGLVTTERVKEIMKFADSIMLGCSFTKFQGIRNFNSMIKATRESNQATKQ